ncbi:MAG TPA: murein biosynthesis integral membrane protein MurJ [Jatrophihabitans sp.]|nr:murein biosynthesis integral membrane protein MurJ [Jatrophihabitans sp.]
MTEDWSEPKLYGSPLPVPGDATALAIRTAQPPDAEDGWSAPIYHGPRRFRPRPEHPVRVNRDANGAQLVIGEQLLAAAPVDSPPAPNGVAPVRPDGSVLPDDPATLFPDGTPATSDVDSLLAPDVDRIQAPPAEPGQLRAPGAEPGRIQEPGTAATATRAAESTSSLMASSRTMAVASLVSRVTGFLRSLVLVAALGIGVGEVADAYNLANTLPNMVYELLLGGVLTSVIIPVLVFAQHSDADQGEAYTQRLLSIATASLGGATVLAVLAAPVLASIFGGSASKQALTALWATLLLPEIFFYGLGAMFTAVLNTRGVFGWPAWAPALNNIITILSVGLFLLLPSASPLTSSNISNSQILVLGVGTTLGIAGQALILWWPLRKIGFSWHWRFRAYPAEAGRMAEFTNLTLWVLGYVAISQVGVFVVNRVANVRAGGPTTFANADLLFQVPYGILGVSLLTALMPRMSRAAARGDQASVLADLRLGTRLSAVALVPVSAGLIVLGPSLTSVIFLGHARLSEARLVGIALASGAFGLLPFALVMLQQRVFYAMRDARTPTFINLIMVGTKVALVFTAYATLHGRAVIVALTVSTSTSYLAGCVAGHLLLRRRFGPLGFAAVLRTVGWIALAALAGAVVAGVALFGVHTVLGSGRLASLLVLLVGGGLGGLVLALVAFRLPLPEVTEILAAVRRRPARSE